MIFRATSRERIAKSSKLQAKMNKLVEKLLKQRLLTKRTKMVMSKKSKRVEVMRAEVTSHRMRIIPLDKISHNQFPVVNQWLEVWEESISVAN